MVEQRLQTAQLESLLGEKCLTLWLAQSVILHTQTQLLSLNMIFIFIDVEILSRFCVQIF